MKQKKRLVTLLFLVGLNACVTINIYFPAAAAERVADQIIQDVWSEEGAPNASSTPVPSPDRDSFLFDNRWKNPLQSQVFALFVPPAEAAEPNLTISTPAIDKLTASMKARHARLEPFYKSGAIGLTNTALITVRNPQAIPLNQRNTVMQLVSDENNDRAALYREIAKANEHPEWETNIRDTFARRWIANAAPGWWYQDSSGTWKQK